MSGKVDKKLDRMNAGIQDLDSRLGYPGSHLGGSGIVNSAQAKLLSDMIGMVAFSMHERNRKKAKSLCFAEVHNDFKANFDVHSYSVLPVAQMENAIDYLANRWIRLNPGEPVPDIFLGGHQPSLF